MIHGLHHLVLFYRDVERARAWFEGVGFEHLRGYHGMHWYRLGDAEVMLHPAEDAVASGSVIHVAVDDAAAQLRRMVEAGLRPTDHQNPGVVLSEPVLRPWGDREFEAQDPEGRWWAFTERRA